MTTKLSNIVFSSTNIESADLVNPGAQNADSSNLMDAGRKAQYVHLRIQMRSGRKSLTTVQGLPDDLDYKKILKSLKRTYKTNGTIINDDELGEVIQVQGDQRKNVLDFLIMTHICTKDQIKIHASSLFDRRCQLRRRIHFPHLSTDQKSKGSELGQERGEDYLQDLNILVRGRTTTSHNHCKTCGKPMKPYPTANFTDRFLYCADCDLLHNKPPPSDTSQKYNILKPADSYFRRPPYPAEIASYLDRYVVGQSEAKMNLAAGVYSHYRRLSNNAENQQHRILQQQPSAANPMMHMNLQGGAVPLSVIHSNMNAANAHMDYQSEGIHSSQISSRALSPATTSAYGFKGISDEMERVRMDKSNLLMLGPSGVGKTFVTQILAKILDVPIAIGDCTSMTQAGYVGEDVESVLQKLLQNAQGNVEKAQHGIVFLDEIDKIAATREASTHVYRDVSGEGVQHALLKLVEGTVANVKSDRKGANGQQSTVQIDTTDILFIASGAFTGLEKIIGQRLDKRGVGFGSSSLSYSITKDDTEQNLINEKRDKLISQADQGDIIKFGMIPEIVGRFPILVPFHSLNKEMLVRVLTEPKNSIITQMKMHFEMDDVSLDFTGDALEEIAQMALERKTGARALRSIIEKVLLLAKFQVPGSDIERICITKECVRDQKSYEYSRRVAEPSRQAAGAV